MLGTSNLKKEWMRMFLAWQLLSMLNPALTGIVGIVAITSKAAKKSKEEQETLLAELRAANMDNATKQKIIKNLH